MNRGKRMGTNGNDAARVREDLARLDGAFRQVRQQLLTEWRKESIAGLGITQARILTYLSEQGPLKASVLADLLCVTSGAVTGLADNLKQLGFIRRERSKEDRRVVMLEITEAGQQHVDAINAKRVVIMERMIRHLSESEIGELTRLLVKMNLGEQQEENRN
ncbi:MarR family transcriptional regulator [Paenibacillaceae bacterium]|nr:MarR family transcriptional regulator [Paenibacillaceae bacterium]